MEDDDDRPVPNLRGRRTPMKAAAVAERRAQALAMRTRGETWESIAAALGYASKGAAHKDLGDALAKRAREVAEALDEFRATEMEHIYELRRVALGVLNTEHLHVNAGQVVYAPLRDNNGDLVLDPETGEPIRTGTPLRDSGPVLASIDRLVKLAERMARLVGADSAIKVESEVKTYNYQINGVDPEALK